MRFNKGTSGIYLFERIAILKNDLDVKYAHNLDCIQVTVAIKSMSGVFFLLSLNNYVVLAYAKLSGRDPPSHPPSLEVSVDTARLWRTQPTFANATADAVPKYPNNRITDYLPEKF